jgi:hypothetical protein
LKETSKKEEATKDPRILLTEEHYNFHSSPYVIRAIKLRTGWVEHVAHTGR